MKLKKIGSLLVALAMCFSLATVAFAANVDTPAGGFSITITNKDADEDNYTDYVYTAYQLFSGVLDEETEGEGDNQHTVTYLSDIKWGSMFGATEEAADAAGATFLAALKEDTGIGSAFTDCDSASDVANVLANNNTNESFVQAFADFVAKYVEDNSLSAAASSGTGAIGNSGEYEYTISGLEPGYYIVLNTQVPTDDASAWTDPILQVVEDVTIEAKSDLPTVKKEIVDNDQTDISSGLDVAYSGDMTYTDDTENEAIGKVGDYTIGTAIWFQITGTLPTNYDSYDTYEMIFHDTESKGLTFDSNSVTVYVDDGNGNLTKVSSGYTVDTSYSDGHTFDIIISNTYALYNESGEIIETTKDSQIVVQYQATLNSDAVIGNDGNPNEVYMEFSNKSYNDGKGKTQPYEVWAFTFELDVSKTNEESVALPGAQFVLENATETAYIAVYDADTDTLITNSQNIEDDTNYYFIWVTAATAVTSGDEQNVTIFESGEDGNFSIVGLDEGTYYLKEIAAPDGYNMLDGAIKLVIEATYDIDETTGDVTCTSLTITVNTDEAKPGNTTSGVVDTTVINKHGSTLPSTGGIGTTIFYIIGGVLVVGAAVVLIARRRMSSGDAE